MTSQTSARFRALFTAGFLLCAAALSAMGQTAGGQASGTLAGRVFNSSFGMPLIGVQVQVVGTNLTASTDLGGNYRVEGVPAGTVEVEFSQDGFFGGVVSDVEVSGGAVTRLDTSLDPADDDVIVAEEFKVTASALEGSPTRQIMARKTAVVPLDRFDSSEFSKFSGSDASDLLRLMPGVSISSGPSGKFAVVRGLAERYNPVMLDGVVLPSPDPERQTPQLDLFPSKLMDSLVVFKAANPELPSFSSGGAIDIRTRPFPEQRNGQIQVGLNFDEAVFEGGEFSDYRTKGDRDLWAQGKKDRAAGVPSVVQPNGGLFYYQDPDTTFGFRSSSVPIGARFSLNYEDRFPLGSSDREFAYGVNLAYDSKYTTGAQSDMEPLRYIRPGEPLGDDPSLFESNDYADSTEEVSIGLIGVVGMKLGPEHTITLSAFIAQNGEDSVTAGLSAAQDGSVRYHALHYKQRNLTNLRLGGEHVIGSSIEGRLRWRLARVSTSQDEPDFRFVPYGLDATTEGAFSMIAGGPERRLTRYWRAVDEKTWSGGMDYGFRLQQAFVPDLSIKVGFSAESTERGFDEQMFFWGGTSFNFDDFERQLARLMNERAFNSEGLPAAGMGGGYSDVAAQRDVLAPFVGISARLWESSDAKRSLTFNTGVQWERYQMDVNGFNIWGNYSVNAFYNANRFLLDGAEIRTEPEPDAPVGSNVPRYFNDQEKDSTLPSAGIVFSPRESVFLRLNVSKTTARPSFREAGPYYTVDQITLANVAGNIAVRPSSVENLDLRAEYFFPKSLDLIALSVFAKNIDGAIERVGLEGEFSPKLTDTWVNNPATARVRGVEAEFRKNLGFAGRWFEGVTLGGNGAWIDAEVERLPFELKSPELFRATRRLYDQPEWIANGYLSFASQQVGFSTTLSFSMLSDVLRAANQVTVDEFLEGHSRLDLTVSQRIGREWTLRLSASNLTNPERRVILDRAYVSSGDAGGFAFSRWSEGRSYSVSMQRNF